MAHLLLVVSHDRTSAAKIWITARLNCVEYERVGARRAAERFTPSLPWLLGAGTGAPVEVTAGGLDAVSRRVAEPAPAGR